MTKRGMNTPRGRPARGLPLFEALMASVLLAICAMAVTLPFTASIQNDNVQHRWTYASGLAQELMEEILARPFDDPDGPGSPGPEGGESPRADYDNLDDFHGLNEPAGGLTDFTGNAISDPMAGGLSRHATVEYVYVSGQDTQAEPTFVRATVEVRHGGEPLITLTRLVYASEK